MVLFPPSFLGVSLSFFTLVLPGLTKSSCISRSANTSGLSSTLISLHQVDRDKPEEK